MSHPENLEFATTQTPNFISFVIACPKVELLRWSVFRVNLLRMTIH
jgi:hypothetical protein